MDIYSMISTGLLLLLVCQASYVLKHSRKIEEMHKRIMNLSDTF